LYPNKNHSILGKDARAHLYRRVAEHFERYLRP
jgi:dipeptidyl aminopeptidase/acylaminoacyl peptidase